MTLGEKICWYRKKNKFSQEELAARVGVSRQAVSKWELGDAVPEVEKLRLLAQVFSVTTDELLSPDLPGDEGTTVSRTDKAGMGPDTSPAAGEYAFRSLGRLIRRHGWLAGLYMTFSGLGILLVGALGWYNFRRMFSNDLWSMARPGLEMGRMVLVVPAIAMAVGVLIAVGGVILAVVLYRKGRSDP